MCITKSQFGWYVSTHQEFVQFFESEPNKLRDDNSMGAYRHYVENINYGAFGPIMDSQLPLKGVREQDRMNLFFYILQEYEEIQGEAKISNLKDVEKRPKGLPTFEETGNMISIRERKRYEVGGSRVRVQILLDMATIQENLLILKEEKKVRPKEIEWNKKSLNLTKELENH